MIKNSFKENQTLVKREVNRVVNNWIDAFIKKNPEKMLPFYAYDDEGFTFIYNNSEQAATDKQTLLDGYKGIMDVDSIDVIFEEKSLSFPSITDSRIFCVGRHFVTIRKGVKVAMDLTYFTLALKPAKDGLKILHHHSSFPVTETTMYELESDEDLEPWPFYLTFANDSIHRMYKSVKDETPTVDAKIS